MSIAKDFGDIEFLAANGWIRGVVFREGSTHFGVAVLGGTERELKNFCGKRVDVKRAIIEHLQRCFLDKQTIYWIKAVRKAATS